MGKSKIPESVLQDICSYREAGEAWERISEMTGVKPGTCKYHAVRLGAYHGSKREGHKVDYSRKGRAVRVFTPDEDREITLLTLVGLNPTEIGRTIGRSHNSVLCRLRLLALRDAMEEAA